MTSSIVINEFGHEYPQASTDEVFGADSQYDKNRKVNMIALYSGRIQFLHQSVASFYHPQRSCEGYVFYRRVSVHGGGGGQST